MNSNNQTPPSNAENLTAALEAQHRNLAKISEEEAFLNAQKALYAIDFSSIEYKPGSYFLDAVKEINELNTRKKSAPRI